MLRKNVMETNLCIYSATIDPHHIFFEKSNFFPKKKFFFFFSFFSNPFICVFQYIQNYTKRGNFSFFEAILQPGDEFFIFGPLDIDS